MTLYELGFVQYLALIVYKYIMVKQLFSYRNSLVIHMMRVPRVYLVLQTENFLNRNARL
jgi:hypothetical protein